MEMEDGEQNMCWRGKVSIVGGENGGWGIGCGGCCQKERGCVRLRGVCAGEGGGEGASVCAGEGRERGREGGWGGACMLVKDRREGVCS